MKIIAIRIKNLASLEGSTEIDFTKEPLCSAGIFAITGPTGAGKSTVLDALCLALYCKTPRYLQAKESGIEITDVQGNAISQGDVRGILRDGTGEGFAEVDFVGVDGQRYRATWRVRRARDRSDGGLQQYSIALKNIDTNTDIPGRKNEIQVAIERLVGLSFEQFTRSVLLAQGDFTAFLKADKEEKSALLEKLTGTRIYSEISQQIFVNYSIQKRELEDLNLQRQGIATLTSEEREDLEREKSLMEQRIAILENEAALLNKEVAWHTQLILLQGSFSAAHNAYEHSTQAKQNASDRQQELNLVEQVQSTRSWVDGKLAAEKQLGDKELELERTQTRLGNLQEEKEVLDRQFQTANEKVTATIQKQEEAVPLLEEARVLDVQTKEKVEQVKQAAADVKTIEDSYQELEQQLKDQQQQSEQLFASIRQLQQWKEKHNSQQPIAENHGLIDSKFGDAWVLLDTEQSLLPKLKTTQDQIAEIKQVQVDLETKSGACALHLNTKKGQYTTVTEELAAIPIRDAENEKAAIDTSIEELVAAEAHWKFLFLTKVDVYTLKRNLEGNKNELIHKGQSLARASEQLLLAASERNASLRMLDKARLAAAANVESLRSQLIPEEPCPVCGSEQHPYVNEHPQLNHLLTELEATHDQIDKAYATWLQTESTLQETIRRIKEAIIIQEQETNSKQIALAEYEKTWKKFAIYPQSTGIPDEQKATWLAEQLQDTRATQKKLQQLIHSYAAQKLEQDRLEKFINVLERQYNENTNAIKDANRHLQSLQEQESQHRKHQQLNNIALAAIEQSLSAYFNEPSWFTDWKNDPIEFLKGISDFAKLWKDNIQKVEDYSRQHGILEAKLEVSKGLLENAFVDLQRKQAVLVAVSQKHRTLTDKRMAIFNGEAAASIAQGLKQSVTTAQEALEKIKAELEIKQTSLTRTITQREQAEKDLVSFDQYAATFAQKIEEWITAFNSRYSSALDNERLLQLLTYDANWIEAERVALRMIDDAITQTQSVFHERSEQLQKHVQQRNSQRSAEELNELLNTARTHLQQQLLRKNEFGFRLQQDVANKQKIGDLLGVIKAKELVSENWAKLNDIIGSADGKKFRLIAQEYTLDVLLGYANVHLGMLSNRYLLQRIPNTLALQVIDQDMGYEVRTVYSLSGGESFLASLALALGLASLSSSRMQVESLFIDEGFGSLDPATLNIAMDALERLHNQGRKVGVISHVQEMTERIPVQIKVSKQQSGRSKVEVTNII